MGKMEEIGEGNYGYKLPLTKWMSQQVMCSIGNTVNNIAIICMATDGNLTYCGDHFVKFKLSNQYVIHLKLTWYCKSITFQLKSMQKESRKKLIKNKQ